MPDTLFSASLLPARASTARAGALPLSLAAHAAALAAVLAVPLVGATAPPPLHSRAGGPVVLTVPPPPQDPPPARVAVVRAQPRARAVRDTTFAPAAAAPTRLVPLGDVPPLVPGHDPGPCSGCVLSTTAAAPDGSGTAPATGAGGTGGGGEGAPGPLVAGRDVRPPVKIRHVDPQYPDLARRAGLQGSVVVECLIDAGGRVAQARVTRGMPVLDGPVLAAVRQWRYRPTLVGGVAVPVLMTVTVHFRLR